VKCVNGFAVAISKVSDRSSLVFYLLPDLEPLASLVIDNVNIVKLDIIMGTFSDEIHILASGDDGSLSLWRLALRAEGAMEPVAPPPMIEPRFSVNLPVSPEFPRNDTAYGPRRIAPFPPSPVASGFPTMSPFVYTIPESKAKPKPKPRVPPRLRTAREIMPPPPGINLSPMPPNVIIPPVREVTLNQPPTTDADGKAKEDPCGPQPASDSVQKEGNSG
jgi:hypothetical protein